jgi:hypothetical protein
MSTCNFSRLFNGIHLLCKKQQNPTDQFDSVHSLRAPARSTMWKMHAVAILDHFELGRQTKITGGTSEKEDEPK